MTIRTIPIDRTVEIAAEIQRLTAHLEEIKAQDEATRPFLGLLHVKIERTKTPVEVVLSPEIWEWLIRNCSFGEPLKTVFGVKVSYSCELTNCFKVAGAHEARWFGFVPPVEGE